MINKELYNTLKEKGISELTSAQKEAIPKILAGKDVLLCAPTGYGKTLAVMIPILDKMLKNKKEGMKTLYITPLRALNRDIFDRMVYLGKKVGLRIEVRHGDTTQYQRKKQSENPPDMLITTPETLQAILSGSKMREAARTVDTVIIDELHELVSSKRGAQLSIGIERLKKETINNIQLIGLSATINNKEEVAKWLSSTCEVINVEGDKKYEFKVIKPQVTEDDKELAKKLHTNPSIASSLKIIQEAIKKHKTIIFVNTRELAENITSRLNMLGVKEVSIHHSSLSKESRENTEDAFRKGTIKGIISTSSLELGIDVGDIELVLQYNSPRQANKLVQRVGRSGHTSKQVSRGAIITTSEHDYMESNAIVEKIKEKWVEESQVYHKPLDVLAHQIVGYCITGEKPKIKDIYENVKKAKPYETLDWEEYTSVINLLSDNRIIFKNEDGTIGTGMRGRMYYYDNISTIPNEKNYKIINMETNTIIGTLHEGFIAKYGKEGNVFICRAHPWEIINIEKDRVSVSRSFDFDSAIPSWEGELIPIHKEISEKARKILGKKRKLENNGTTVILTTYFGSKINQTLAELLAHLIMTRKETKISTRSDAYRIVISLKDIDDLSILQGLLNEIKPTWVGPVMYEAVKNSNAFLYRFMHVAKRFGILRKDTEFNNHLLKKILEKYDNTPVTKEAFKEMLVEKLDINGTEWAIAELNNENLIMEPASEETLNELSTGFKDFSNPKTAKEIMSTVKERLLNNEFIYYCLQCGKYAGKLMVRDSKNLNCTCGSKLLTFIKPNHEDKINVLKKKLSNQPLSNIENKEYKKLEENANMYLNYGHIAPYAISGRGIGTRTALRILKGFYKTEDDFLKKIIEEEKNFIKNKKYWK